MIFYRSAASQTNAGPSLASLRLLSVVPLVAYPIGAALLVVAG